MRRHVPSSSTGLGATCENNNQGTRHPESDCRLRFHQLHKCPNPPLRKKMMVLEAGKGSMGFASAADYVSGRTSLGLGQAWCSGIRREMPPCNLSATVCGRAQGKLLESGVSWRQEIRPPGLISWAEPRCSEPPRLATTTTREMPSHSFFSSAVVTLRIRNSTEHNSSYIWLLVTQVAIILYNFMVFFPNQIRIIIKNPLFFSFFGHLNFLFSFFFFFYSFTLSVAFLISLENWKILNHDKLKRWPNSKLLFVCFCLQLNDNY